MYIKFLCPHSDFLLVCLLLFATGKVDTKSQHKRWQVFFPDNFHTSNQFIVFQEKKTPVAYSYDNKLQKYIIATTIARAMTSQHLQREPDDDVYLDGLLEQVFAKLDTNQRFYQCDRSEKNKQQERKVR